MKIFLVLSNFPYAQGEAIEVVGDEAVSLIAQAGHDLCVQVLLRDGRTAVNVKREQAARDRYAYAANVKFLEPIFLDELQPRRGRIGGGFARFVTLVLTLPGLRRWINRRLFPAKRATPYVRRAVAGERPDIVLTIWSWESLAATYSIRDVPKFMYYGNPDHKPMEARLRHPELFDMDVTRLTGWMRYRYLKLLNAARELQHLRMMRCCEVVANNSMVDAIYYRDRGHPRSIYLHNMWPDMLSPASHSEATVPPKTFRIVGSVGNLGATGNTFGLHFIGRYVAPGLEARVGKENFSIDIYGGGRPTHKVATTLQHPAIRLRGWVDNLNSEIKSSHVFLVLTNVDGFVVGNTRILLAWSLGACIVAHADSALSMPEVRHGENALLGRTPDEINDLIVEAASDPALRQRIGAGGRAAFQQYYRSDIVVPKMLEEMQRCIHTFHGASG